MRDPNAKTDALTRVQRETFFFIRFYVIARGHPPTIRQMATQFKKGYIQVSPNAARGIKILKTPTDPAEVSVVR